MTAALVMFLALGLLLALEAPIAAALGAAGILGIAGFCDVPLGVVASRLCGTLDNWNLMAVPFFIIAGEVLTASGISRRLVRLASLLVGRMPGGLAVVTVVVSIFFAGISGSGPADVAALGAVLIPAMIAAGYGRGFASALMAAGGGLGIIVPPSIAMILYGVAAEVSIRRLFVAGVVPGILVGASLIVYVLVRFWKDAAVLSAPRGSLREIGRAFRDASWGIMAPVIILGGIYGGVFTPTESAAVAVLYALAVDLLVYRELTWRGLARLLADCGVTSAKVLIVVATASLFAFALEYQQVPSQIAAWLADSRIGVVTMLLSVNALLLIVGCFLDAISIIYIFTPILMPPIRALGIDPIHFGVILTINLAIGQITPPVGVNLFIASGLSGAPLNDVSKHAIPLAAVQVLALAVITFVPAISLWLPGLIR